MTYLDELPDPEEPRVCHACSAPARADALFCNQCGASLTEDPEPVESSRPAEWRRSRLRTAGEELWQTFRPALWLWILLLASSGLVGLLAHLQDITSPAYDAAVTLFDAVVIILFCVSDRDRLLPLLTHSGITGRTWHLPLLGFVGFMVFMWVYFAILGLLGADTYAYLEDYDAHGWPLWSAFVLIAVCPAIFEELAFRGVIMSRLEEMMTRKEALLVQAGLFSVIHFSPLIFVSHFVLGVAFGQLRRTTGSLYPGMLLHMAWNAWVVIEERMG